MPQYTIEQYEALTEAISLGISQVSYAGKTTVYRSLQEMRDLANEMEIQLGLADANVRLYTKFNSGRNKKYGGPQ